MAAKRISVMALLAGLAVATGLVAWQGVGAVVASMALVGGGVLLIAAWYILPLVIQALAWQSLFPRHRTPSLSVILPPQWIGLAVNWLLPVATVGGELVKALQISRRGVPGPLAGATVVADKFVQALSQLLWGFLGVLLLIHIEAGSRLWPGLLATALLFAVLLAVFLYAQRKGTFARLARRLEKLASGQAWLNLVGNAERLDAALIEVYRQPWRVAAACGYRLLARILITGEIWLAQHLMGYEIGLIGAMMLESLSAAVRAAVFAVPAGLGAQEGAFVVLGQVLGITPEAALAISLLKRVRELIVGIPALLLWQLGEGKRLLARRGAK